MEAQQHAAFAASICSGGLVLLNNFVGVLNENGQTIAIVCTMLSTFFTFLNYRLNVKRSRG